MHDEPEENFNDDRRPDVKEEEADELGSYLGGPLDLSFLTSYAGHVTRQM